MTLIYNQAEHTDVAPFIAQRLLDLLSGGRKVLWLLSGGSGGAVCVEVSKLIASADLTGLYVALTDERYGPIGHSDENMQILMDAGLTLPGATIYRTLSDKAVGETAEEFSGWLASTSGQVDYTLAVLGIGEDGHVCGIKPNSSAVNHPGLATHFLGDDFERITVTPTYLRTIDEAVVQAYGGNKHEVIGRLLSREGDVATSPMLTVYDIPKVTVFSDYAN